MASTMPEKQVEEPRASNDETIVAADEMKAEATHIQEMDPKIEERIFRKQDYHILPWLFGIWLCAFIDRSNIGNARIDGLTDDLNLRGTMFNIALGRHNNDPLLAPLTSYSRFLCSIHPDRCSE